MIYIINQDVQAKHLMQVVNTDLVENKFKTKYPFWLLTKISGDKLVPQNLKVHK